ncbi:MAG: hypothetical protein GEU71_03680 [Actinobacteria bacterium]|nr:hypothetical protein [Actinomycetota bacterium]
MPTFTKATSGGTDLIEAEDLNQIIDALIGTSGKGVPLSPTAVSDAIAYALSVKNTDATNSRAAIFYAADGSVLFQADGNGVKASPDGSQSAAAVVTRGDSGTVTTEMLEANAVTQIEFDDVGNSGPTTTSTTFVDLDGMTMGITTTGGVLLAMFTGTFSNDTVGERVDVRLVLDGVPAANSIRRFNVPAANYRQTLMTQHLWTGVSSAAHTVKAQWLASGGTGTADGLLRSMLIAEVRR